MAEKRRFFGARSGAGASLSIGRSIRGKLMLALLLLSLIPLAAVGIVADRTARGALRSQVFDNLQAVEANKVRMIESYFAGRGSDLHTLAESVGSLRDAAFQKLRAIQRNKIERLEIYIRSRLTSVKVLADVPYVSETLTAMNDPALSGLEDRRRGRFADYVADRGFTDLLLVSEDGTIRLSVQDPALEGETLPVSEEPETPLEAVFQEGLTGFTVTDMDIEARHQTIQAAKPVFSGENRIGVLIVRIPLTMFESIVHDRTGMAPRTESTLVGRVGEVDSLRTDRTLREGAVGDLEFGEAAFRGLSGESGFVFNVSDAGVFEVSHYDPLAIQGLQWALVTTAVVQEILTPREAPEGKNLFENLLVEFGFGDLYLFSPGGFLFYTVKDRVDRNTNFNTGPFQITNLGRLYKQVAENRTFGMVDFEKYAPGGNIFAAFLAEPVLSETGEIDVIVAAQVTTDQVNAVMQDRTGLGKTGESYLVGADMRFRSDSRFLNDLGVSTTVMNDDIKVVTEATRSAFAGKTGVTVIENNYRNQKVLSAWAPVTVSPPSEVNPRGIRWAAVAEIDHDEVFAPVSRMVVINGALFAAVFVLVIIFAWFLSRGLTTQVRHIMDLFSEIGMGNFEARTAVKSKDELGQMAVSLNAMLDNTLSLIQSSEERDQMQQAVIRLLDDISGFAEGDLTKRAEVTEDFTGAIADAFNDMADKLSDVVMQVTGVTRQVGRTAYDVTRSTEALAVTSEEQAEQVVKAVAAIRGMNDALREMAENAGRSAAVSDESTQNAREGAQAVRNTNQAMESIQTHVQETARAIKRLGESSQEIGNIVQLINDIADRTSILALNASIQAAMAGETGRGFAVVAEEVQRLAERSTNATGQIDTLIKNIQGEIGEAGTSMEESIQRVVEGSNLADDAFRKLEEIETVSERLAEMIRSISDDSRKQAADSMTVAGIMETVGEVSGRVSAESRNTAAAMRRLAETSDTLNESVSVFRIEETKPPEDSGEWDNPESTES
jgi:methyl-accepting chemotaxis protein